LANNSKQVLKNNALIGNILLNRPYLQTNPINVNAALTSNPYGIKNASTAINITLTDWRESYNISKLYIYIGSDIKTLVFSLGQQNINTNILSFTKNITCDIGSYYLYLSNVDPASSDTPLVNQFISSFEIKPLLSLTPSNSNKILVSSGFDLSGKIDNWNPAEYPTTLNLFYTSIYTSKVFSNEITIKNDGTFTTTISSDANQTLPGLKFAVGDGTTLESSSIISTEFTLYAIPTPITVTLTSNTYAILTLKTNYTISLSYWNPSYPTSMYIYLDNNGSIHSFGKHRVLKNKTINFTTIIPDTVIPGQYNLYISDQDPTSSNPTIINQYVSVFNVNNQISISTLNSVPNPIQTYQEYTLTGKLSNWYSALYPNTIYLSKTLHFDNSVTKIKTSIDSDGSFTYTSSESLLSKITIALVDSSEYIKSPGFELNSIPGHVDACLSNPEFGLAGKSTDFTIELNEWNESYPSKLYIYLGSNISTVIHSFGQHLVSNNSVTFKGLIPTNIDSGFINVYLSDQDPLKDIQQNINQLVSSLAIVPKITLTITNTIKTYTPFNIEGTVNNWNSLLFPSELYLTYTELDQNKEISVLTSIGSDGKFTYSNTVNTFPGITIRLSDNNNYLKSDIITLNTIAGPVDPVLISNPYTIINTNANYTIKLTRWNSTYPSKMYIYIGSSISNVIYSFGYQNVNVVNNNIRFSANITTNISAGVYNLYMSDQNPLETNTTLINEIINEFTVYEQLIISTIVPTPNPIETYEVFVLNGVISNWNSDVYPDTLNLFILQKRVPVSIKSDGTFSISSTVTKLPNFTISLSNESTYGTGKIESNIYTLNVIAGAVNPELSTTNYAIVNKSTDVTIKLTIWNSSYPKNMYVYLATPTNTLIASLGLHSTTSSKISFNTTISDSILPGTYSLYISDLDPEVSLVGASVNQFVSLFYIGQQIYITSLTPSPIVTYTNMTLSGKLSNWVSNFYPNSLNLLYTKVYDNTTSIINTIINSDGSFSLKLLENTLTEINIKLSDPSNYLQSDQITLNTILGNINAKLTTKPYAIKNKSTNFSITLTSWNASYPTNLDIYIGSDVSTVIHSFGQQTVNFNNNEYSINFSEIVPDTIINGSYNLYLLDQVISPFTVTSQIEITSLTSPNPIDTFNVFNITGQLSNWNSNLYPNTLQLFYTTIHDNYKNTITTNINSDGTFTYSDIENTTPGFTISISDSFTYGTGYIESNVSTVSTIIGSVDAKLTSNSITYYNTSLNYNIVLTNWNSSYNINNLYIYLDSTNIYSFGSKSIDSNKINFTETIQSSDIPIGKYNLYLSDVDPTSPATPLVNQLISSFEICTKFNISILPSSTKFVTYTDTQFDCVIDNWLPEYPNTMNLFYNNNFVETIDVSSTGHFSCSYITNTIDELNISLSDSTGDYQTYNIILIPSIGPVNASIDISNIIQNKTIPVTIILNNWNSSYNINNIHVYLGSDTQLDVIESYGTHSIILDTDDKYKITFNLTPKTSRGNYNIYINDIKISNLTIYNQPLITSITPRTTFITYTSTTFDVVLSNWITEFDSRQMYVTYYSSYDNEHYSKEISISNDGTFSFTHTENYYGNFNVFITDKTDYIESDIYTITNIGINLSNIIFNNSYLLQNIPSTLNFTLNQWNDSYPSSLSISIGSESLGSHNVLYNNDNYSINISDIKISLPLGTYLISLHHNESIISNSLELLPQISLESLTITNTKYNGSLSNWSTLFPDILYIFVGSNELGRILINNDGTFTFNNYVDTNYNTNTIRLSDTHIYENGYIKSDPYQFTTPIGNINASVTPTTYVNNESQSYTITLTQWNDKYSNINKLYVFSATSTDFKNLTFITEAPINTNTIEFATTFINKSYYFVISDIPTPLVNAYKIFQIVNMEVTEAPLPKEDPMIYINSLSITGTINSSYGLLNTNNVFTIKLSNPENIDLSLKLSSWSVSANNNVITTAPINSNQEIIFSYNPGDNIESLYFTINSNIKIDTLVRFTNLEFSIHQEDDEYIVTLENNNINISTLNIYDTPTKKLLTTVTNFNGNIGRFIYQFDKLQNYITIGVTNNIKYSIPTPLIISPKLTLNIIPNDIGNNWGYFNTPLTYSFTLHTQYNGIHVNYMNYYSTLNVYYADNSNSNNLIPVTNLITNTSGNVQVSFTINNSNIPIIYFYFSYDSTNIFITPAYQFFDRSLLNFSLDHDILTNKCTLISNLPYVLNSLHVYYSTTMNYENQEYLTNVTDNSFIGNFPKSGLYYITISNVPQNQNRTINDLNINITQPISIEQEEQIEQEEEEQEEETNIPNLVKLPDMYTRPIIPNKTITIEGIYDHVNNFSIDYDPSYINMQIINENNTIINYTIDTEDNKIVFSYDSGYEEKIEFNIINKKTNEIYLRIYVNYN
jgi:hypothetical protein